MEVVIYHAPHMQGIVRMEELAWEKPVSMFRTGEFILELLRQRTAGGAIAGVAIPSRVPHTVFVSTAEHRDFLSTYAGGDTVEVLSPPPVLSGPYFSLDYASFPGRGNITNRSGLIVRHGRGFATHDDLERADTAAAFPPVAWLTNGRFEIRSSRFANNTDRNAAIYCYKKHRIFVEPVFNIFMKAQFVNEK